MKTLKKLMPLFLLLFIVCSNCTILGTKHNPINDTNTGISTQAIDEEYYDSILF